MYLSKYIHPDAVKLSKQYGGVADISDRIREIDAVILRTTNITYDIISQTSSLRITIEHSVGYNIIDLEAVKKYKIPAINIPKASTNSVAEPIIGLVFNVRKGIAFCDAKSRHEGFGQTAPLEMTGVELTGKTVGLVGVSNIALRIGEIPRNGLDTVLVGYDLYCIAEQIVIFGIKKYNDLNKMLEVFDIVNINVPLAPSIKNLIIGDSFLHFKKSTVSTNVARGGTVSGSDLYTAPKARQPRTAACDVFVKEPSIGENRLAKLSNLYAASHIGANTKEALYHMGMETVKAVAEAIEGNAAKYQVVQGERMTYYEQNRVCDYRRFQAA